MGGPARTQPRRIDPDGRALRCHDVAGASEALAVPGCTLASPHPPTRHGVEHTCMDILTRLRLRLNAIISDNKTKYRKT